MTTPLYTLRDDCEFPNRHRPPTPGCGTCRDRNIEANAIERTKAENPNTPLDFIFDDRLGNGLIFIEVEDGNGNSVGGLEQFRRSDGYWVIRTREVHT